MFLNCRIHNYTVVRGKKGFRDYLFLKRQKTENLKKKIKA